MRDSDRTSDRARVRYAKTGKLRFIGAIDLGRVWERALRRADLPIAYSEGFSPHPKVSFTEALPLGYASTGEYAELTFAGPVELGSTMRRLNAAFPDGVEVLDVVAVNPDDPKLAKWLSASLWLLEYEADGPAVAAAVAELQRAGAIPVERTRKDATTTIDLRPALAGVAAESHAVRAVLHHQEPAVRPSELHSALTTRIPELQEPIAVTRLGQGRAVDGGLEEALSGELLPVEAPRLVTIRTESDHS